MGKARKIKFDKDRTESGGYVAIPHLVLRSVALKNLSSHGTKLLMDLVSQYLGRNNGDLSAPFSTMKKDRGWKSKGTLNRAIKDLLESGLIIVSRQGGRHKCSLYALTYIAIDECGGKLDIKATDRPLGLWRKHEPALDIQQAQKIKQEHVDAKLMKDICKRMEKSATPYESQLSVIGSSVG